VFQAAGTLAPRLTCGVFLCRSFPLLFSESVVGQRRRRLRVPQMSLPQHPRYRPTRPNLLCYLAEGPPLSPQPNDFPPPPARLGSSSPRQLVLLLPPLEDDLEGRQRGEILEDLPVPEKRHPTDTKNPRSLHWGGNDLQPSRRGPHFLACVGAISSAMASLPADVYRTINNDLGPISLSPLRILRTTMGPFLGYLIPQ
jgi:hypothetical protein